MERIEATPLESETIENWHHGGTYQVMCRVNIRTIDLWCAHLATVRVLNHKAEKMISHENSEVALSSFADLL